MDCTPFYLNTIQTINNTSGLSPDNLERDAHLKINIGKGSYDGPSVKEKIFKYFFHHHIFGG